MAAVSEVSVAPIEVVRQLEEHHRPGGSWTYDPDSARRDTAVVFPERLLLRIDAAPQGGYTWAEETFDPIEEVYKPTPGRTGTAGSVHEMLVAASTFIDDHNQGDAVPVSAYPLAYELEDRIAAGYPGAHWKHYQNSVYASVFEYPGLRRIQFWDEADFMGSISGYTWIEEAWSPESQSWQQQAESDDVVTITQMQQTIVSLHRTGEHVHAVTAAGGGTPTGRLDRATLERLMGDRSAQLHPSPVEQTTDRDAPGLGVDPRSR